jgi:hypothetical protein
VLGDVFSPDRCAARGRFVCPRRGAPFHFVASTISRVPCNSHFRIGF